MSIDTTTPRTRRALIAGALGGVLASVAALAKAPVTRAGVDGDVVLDDTNTGAGTTEISATSSNPAFRVVGGGVGLAAISADGHALRASSTTSVGVRGVSGISDVDVPDPITPSTGVYGISLAGAGVYGASDTGMGVYAANNASTVAAIVAEGEPGTAIHGHAGAGPVPASPALTGLYGSAVDAGVAIAADSAGGLALRATSSAGNGIRSHGQLDGVIGESGGDHTGVVGFSGAGAAPAGPDKTGVYGEATQDAAARGVAGRSTLGQGVRGDATSGQGVRGVATTGQGVRGDATTGVGVQATASTTGIAFTSTSVTGLAVWAQSTQGNAIKGRGLLDGVIGEAANGNSGVVGFSGAATAPPGPAKTGVYGEATQDSAARGVFGKSTTGQGVRGEATTGIGVQGVATTGVALGVSGRVVLNRSGRVSVPANRSYVDITVPGGLGAPANVFAMIQTNRVGVFVTGVLSNYPSAGKARIILNKVASTTLTTPVAWFVLN